MISALYLRVLQQIYFYIFRVSAFSFCLKKKTPAKEKQTQGYAPRPRQRRAAVHGLRLSIGSSAHSHANAPELELVCNITEAPPVADEARRCWRLCFESRSCVLLRKPFPRLSHIDFKHCGAAIESLIIKTGWFAIFALPKSRNRVCFRQFKSTKVLYRLLPTSDSRKGCPYEMLRLKIA